MHKIGSCFKLATHFMTIHHSLNSFFTQLSITLNDQYHSHVDTDSVEPDDNMIAVLPHYGLLAINGPDTAKFLQGQTTCNLDEIDDTHTRPGAYCTPKGRMVTSFQLARLNSENYLLRMRRPLVESSQAVLAKYIVFSKAEQYNASDKYLVVGLHGDKAKAAINTAFGTTPKGLHESVINDGNIAIQLDQTGKTFECWVLADNVPTLWPTLSDGLHLQGSQSWELLAIRHGQGEVTEQTTEAFTPQMLNYQITGAVSFTKGCYTGQEVVARLHYKGKLKRHMYRIMVEASPLSPGATIYNSTGEQRIGEIVNAVSLNDHQTEALAVIAHKDIEENTLTTDTKIKVLSLPYAINSDAP